MTITMTVIFESMKMYTREYRMIYDYKNHHTLFNSIVKLIDAYITREGKGGQSRLARSLAMSPSTLTPILKGRSGTAVDSPKANRSSRFKSLVKIADYIGVKVYFKTKTKTYNMLKDRDLILQDLRTFIRSSDRTQKELAKEAGVNLSILAAVAQNSRKSDELGILTFTRIYSAIIEPMEVEIIDTRCNKSETTSTFKERTPCVV